ncbi:MULTISPECIES: Hsp20/alpha crystallin family protein [Dyadobacter]|uniref:Hsp20/alpha crystallin family protein n=2 Tax=Dyadobacter TaxID=120831 RepID=A0A9X1TJ30_9BACT|nr:MULTISPECIES: Hsp20/alpha crystallin family protein [Dyadobacter]MCF0043582.1 Hsp20/alpha crystallin family protein [Dyadobacter fanqingshengii]MCF0049679.1 Hsp20/alpha crystallin family protein [Dyadobacter chenwenxiniae]MCF0062105.1 Hsp20/alpha crystallin family protein [Dyadobacter chenwenxiniae]MCF2504069.1 Hsp20/alpha crystallin family protein [Dyadobacter fanqingshengii]UON81910.1 Hsp20/alpha crystallin family protein [Dyadobacter chenwenxiniae]
MSTLVKTHFANPSYVNGFFGKDLFNELANPAFSGSVPAVNVVESKEGFRIEVAAPGLQKSDFKLNLEKNQLTISAQKEQKEEDANEKYTRREFKYSSFQRTFTLPNSVDGDKIEATYNEGVLSIALPKREEAKEKPARTIDIA